jgi:hypothetical protein
MEFIDYIYYRVCDYYKRKKDSTAESTGVLVISLIEFFFILDILVIIRIFWEYPFPENFNKYWGLPPAILIAYLNWKKYQKPRKYREFKKMWKDEESEKREVNGISIILLIIVVFSIPILYGFIKHNIIEGKSFFM